MFAMSGRTSVVSKLNVVCRLFLLLGLLSFPAEANLNFHKTWAPDCVVMNIISINGEHPGRNIRVRAGDTVVVQLKDLMPTGNVVIRWQGIRQIGTHYGLKQSVGFYGSLIVDAVCKEPFIYNCQLSTHEQATGLSSRQFFGEHQVDGITAVRQNPASDKNINKWSQFAERESFAMMGTGIINGEEEKRWTGQCKRVNTQRKLLNRRILPDYPKPNKGEGPHHNFTSR